MGKIDKMENFLGKVKKWKKRSVEGLWVKLTKLGKVKKWKKQPVEGLWVELTKRIFFLEKVKKLEKRSVEARADAYLLLKIRIPRFRIGLSSIFDD